MKIKCIEYAHREGDPGMFVEFDNAGLACYVKRDEGGWREDTRGHFRHAPRFSQTST